MPTASQTPSTCQSPPDVLESSPVTSIPTIAPSGYRHAKRLQRDNTIVGMLLQLGNGQWGVYDIEEKPLTNQSFSTPKQARDAFVEIEKQNVNR